MLLARLVGDLLERVDRAEAHLEPIIGELADGAAEALASLRVLGQAIASRAARSLAVTRRQSKRQAGEHGAGGEQDGERLADLVLQVEQLARRQEGAPFRRLPLRQLPERDHGEERRGGGEEGEPGASHGVSLSTR